MNERSELISKLQKDVKFRAAYIRSKLNLLIPSQLRGLRLKGNTQKQLADEAEMKQPRISAMERPGEIKFSLETLIRMAAAHKVGLQVKFVPFSEMLYWENNYSQDTFTVARLDEDHEFLNPRATNVESFENSSAALASRPTWNEGDSESEDAIVADNAKKPASSAVAERSMGAGVGGR